MVLFLCVEDELVTVRLPSKQTHARGKCLCTCACRIHDYIFVTQEGQERLGERSLLTVQTMLWWKKKMVKLLGFITCSLSHFLNV